MLGAAAAVNKAKIICAMLRNEAKTHATRVLPTDWLMHWVGQWETQPFRIGGYDQGFLETLTGD